MKDNNVVAFYCSNCHKTVWNYEHSFEQLHGKGLCAECLKKQNKPTISKTESVDNYLCKWQKLKEFLNEDKLFDLFKEEFVYGYKNCLLSIKNKMQELEGEDE